MNSCDQDAKLSFLLNGSFKALPPSYIKLRSYFNTYSIQVARSLKLEIPKQLISKSNSCPFCFTSWSYDTASFKLVPEKKLSGKKKKLKKRKKKLDDGSDSDKPTNQMLLKCLICQNTSTFSIFKKSKTLKVKKDIKVNDKEVTNKKKKKKKDKFSGLKVEKVPEFTKSNDSQKKENKANNFTKSLNLPSKKPEKLNTQKVSFAPNSKKKMAKEKSKLKALRNKIVENKSSTKKTLEGLLSLVRN